MEPRLIKALNDCSLYIKNAEEHVAKNYAPIAPFFSDKTNLSIMKVHGKIRICSDETPILELKVAARIETMKLVALFLEELKQEADRVASHILVFLNAQKRQPVELIDVDGNK